MNQSVLFNDEILYSENKKTITFTAMVNGAIVQCIIKTNITTENKARSHFDSRRFDYEILAEDLIEDEQFDQNGNILLSLI